MRMGSILIVLGAAAFVGWIAPARHSGGVGAAAVPSAKADAAANAEAQTRREAWLTGETVLDRESDGHFYADARIENHETRLLVDTGASIVALTGEDARAIGLSWNDDDLVGIGRGASGTVYGVPVHLDRVELGGLEAQDVDAAIIPEGLDVSLLGQSFLSRMRNVRIEGDRMILGGEG